jgi:AcrR family transcriptional regulator
VATSRDEVTSGSAEEGGLKEVIRDFRRDQVITVARRLIAERGTTEVSMDEIATAAGLSRSTVYVYFANREALLRACLAGMRDELFRAVAASWDKDAAPARRLERLVEELLARIDDDPAFFRLALVIEGTLGRGAEAVGDELALISLEIAELIREVYEDGVASGVFRAMDPARATTLIGQQILGVMAVRTADPLPEPRAAVAAETCAFVVSGLGTAGSGSK